jgi:hypothetical protein
MVLPVIMLFAVLILKCAEVTRAKIGANLDARAKFYTTPPGTEPDGLQARAAISRILDVKQSTFGMAVASSERTIGLRPVLPDTFSGHGRVSLLVGTWDFRGMPFKEPKAGDSPVSQRAVTAAAIPNEVYSLANILDGAANAKQGLAESLQNQAVKQLEDMLLKAVGLDNFTSGMSILQMIKNADKITKAFKALDKLDDAFKSVQDLLKRVAQMYQDRLHEDF